MIIVGIALEGGVGGGGGGGEERERGVARSDSSNAPLSHFFFLISCGKSNITNHRYQFEPLSVLRSCIRPKGGPQGFNAVTVGVILYESCY